MGFNYLQTDDRDDYLAQFDSRKKENIKPVLSVTLKDPKGKIILYEVASHKLRQYYKKNYLPHGKSGRRIWRKGLEEKGYTVINNRAV